MPSSAAHSEAWQQGVHREPRLDAALTPEGGMRLPPDGIHVGYNARTTPL